MTHPFELDTTTLQARLDEMVDITMLDLVSEFLIIPKGTGFLEYSDFQAAFEVLKRITENFTEFNNETVWNAILINSRVFVILRSILGMTPPEWATLANSELGSNVTQGAARSLDKNCRTNELFIKNMETRYKNNTDKAEKVGKPIPLPNITIKRLQDLINVAILYISKRAFKGKENFLHRLEKFDTYEGIDSVQYATQEGIPYTMLLYERYLGRPFAGLRDTVSELIGEVMENAVEDHLRNAGVSYRKTKRAERIPGFGQAPDFIIPDERHPVVVIEAKITSDDGTARDKVARMKVLAEQRDLHIAQGWEPYEVVACIDGRGFRERREDMRQLLRRLNGKVFTTSTLDHLIKNTRINEFISKKSN